MKQSILGLIFALLLLMGALAVSPAAETEASSAAIPQTETLPASGAYVRTSAGF